MKVGSKSPTMKDFSNSWDLTLLRRIREAEEQKKEDEKVEDQEEKFKGSAILILKL